MKALADDRVLRREAITIRRLHKRATKEGKRFIATAIEIGKRLSRVRDRIGHGNWLPWRRENFADWSDDTAESTPRGTLGPQTLNLPDVRIDASKVP
jgi:hypothetical protein